MGINFEKKIQLILGSTSPRRREILNYFSLPFRQEAPTFDEEALLFEGDPSYHAQLLAEGKARSLMVQFPKAPILTADTLVCKDGRLFPKPNNDNEAQKTLAYLSGGWHTVYTAVCGAYHGKLIAEVEATRVQLANLTPLQIRHYHNTLHCADKAGAYAIQGAGGLIVHRIEGCYYNVMGLPLGATARVLQVMGINLWDYLGSY